MLFILFCSFIRYVLLSCLVNFIWKWEKFPTFLDLTQASEKIWFAGGSLRHNLVICCLVDWMWQSRAIIIIEDIIFFMNMSDFLLFWMTVKENAWLCGLQLLIILFWKPRFLSKIFTEASTGFAFSRFQAFRCHNSSCLFLMAHQALVFYVLLIVGKDYCPVLLT